MAGITRVLAVEEIDEAQPGQEGVVSCEVIPYGDLDDETLETLYAQSPDWVMEKRPDWIQKHYPNKVN